MALAADPVSVAGGGVAGLAVARAMAMRGTTVTLHEQAPAITEVGAGLQISPNGLRVIDALGLGDALRAVSVKGQAVILRDGASGREVVTLDLTRQKGEYLFVHRARLIEVLEAGARDAGVEIRLNARLEPEKAPGFSIGADGLHSRHRIALNGDRPAFFTGQVAWRAVIEDAEALPVAEVYMGPGRHLVSYPLHGGLRNIVAVEERKVWTDEGWNHGDHPANLRTAFAGFGGPVPGWLERVDRVNLWGLFRHPVAETWADGRMAILGDAAHPTLPFLAQGANMALEDAWVLAACLDRLPVAEAGPAYQAARRDRVVRVIDAATANARNYHLSGPVRLIGHSLLRVAGTVAPGAMLKKFAWLYDHDVTNQPVPRV